MHLLAIQSGAVGDGSEAIDLQQTPADIVILSAADTELACLARAHDILGSAAPTLRLANILSLQHNLSVDLYVERTLSAAKLVIVRLLGGKPYWSYGIDSLASFAGGKNIKLALLPGDRSSDPELARLSSIAPLDLEKLQRYFTEGGIANAVNILEFGKHLMGCGSSPPPAQSVPTAGIYRTSHRGSPYVAIVFYRALIEAGFAAPIDALADALERHGLGICCIYVQSLKDKASAKTLEKAFAEYPPAVIINATGFAVAAGAGSAAENPFLPQDCPVLQAVFSGSPREAWSGSNRGLSARDLAMNVVLPELDGRIMTRALSFKDDKRWHAPTQCRIASYVPEPDRIAFTAELAANWVKLRKAPPRDRRIALVLANYPNRDGRIGNGVGFDTPASTVRILEALKSAGYGALNIPASGNGLIQELLSGSTNARITPEAGSPVLALEAYLRFFSSLPSSVQNAVRERWGEPDRDPFARDGGFHLPIRCYGHLAVGIQPARGYNIDPKTSYHDPALVPPHGYFAFYFWLRHLFMVHAIIHNGKHGNLEWLPGKAVALSNACFPEATLGPLPQLYPFIVNDPGEGTQGKRRTCAVIIDHLTPPLTRADSYGPLRELEALVDEYYLASGVDRRRISHLRKQIFDLLKSSRLDIDAGIDGDESEESLKRVDAYLCDLKEAQIRDGLHIFGESPSGQLETDLLAAMVRVPRGQGVGPDQSLIRALALDFAFGDFDPLNCDMSESWSRSRPEILQSMANGPWRSNGDTVERLEILAQRLIGEDLQCEKSWTSASMVLDEVNRRIRPTLRSCGEGELGGLLAGLDGRFVAPGPSGAPTRGRVDVLPTGRNFFSLDNRAVPTPTAWTLGKRSAEALLARHFQDHGAYPRSLGLSVWGTSNMRTGGDDIAQALAFIGVKPRWEPSSFRITGFEVIPLAKLRRPRVDVMLRISGFFRDAFPLQIELFDRAIRTVGTLEEAPEDNPIAASVRREVAILMARGANPEEASQVAGRRIFGSKPGSYGAGLQALIDEKLWTERADLARAYVVWGSYAYGASEHGTQSEASFEQRLRSVEAVVHNQDNREHDVLDSDDYYQFEGGMSAAVEHASGQKPPIYHNDHSRPERPIVRTLEEEIGRVVRSRVVNPKWIAGVMRHGYKGAFEIAATIDYLFAFAATTGAAKTHHFDLAYDAFIADAEVREFIRDNNRPALGEIAERFCEAATRGLWTPRSNSAYNELTRLVRDLDL